MHMRRTKKFLITLGMLIAAVTASADDNFVDIEFPRGVSLQIPKNWIVLSRNQRITLDSAVQSGLDLSHIDQGSYEMPFAANLYDDQNNVIGILNLRYYPALDVSQQDVAVATSRDIQDLDQMLRENISKEGAAFGMTITSWAGTKRIEINGILAFVTEYTRASLKGPGSFRVRLVRVLAEGRSFTLTVSHHETLGRLLAPITDKVIDSLRLSGARAATNSTRLPVNDPPPASTPSSALTHLWGENWGAGLAYSIAMTWGFGLAPPLVIRYLVLRRSLAKWWAIGITALFWLFNVILFTALGSQSKTHGALLLVAIVSYAILRRGSKEEPQ